MARTSTDLTSIAAVLCEWSDRFDLIERARTLCHQHVSINSGTISLGGFSADEVAISFVRQLFIFRHNSPNASPCVKTELSIDVYDGNAELGKFILISSLNGEVEYTQVDIDSQIARTSRSASIRSE